MPNEQRERDEIRRLITRWVTEIALANANSYFDINKIAEGFSRQLLNLIYGYELIDLNKERVNYPGIDLGDRKAGISFQITARTDAKKIRDSLEKYVRHGLDKEFPAGIRFLIVNDRKANPWAVTTYSTGFDPKRHILYSHDLIGDILELYRSDSPSYPQIKALLQREFGDDSRPGKAGSLLDESEPLSKIANYVQLFRRMYQEETSRFVAMPCEEATGTLRSDQLLDRIGKGAVILGPSGCGKSMLIRWLALNLLDRPMVPLLLEAKYYESDLNELVRREVEAFGFASPTVFFENCQMNGKQVLLLLDGLNECAVAKQPKLVTELERIVRRYNVNFLISTQTWEDKATELGGIRISVDFPSLEVKTAIAGCDDPAIEPVLSVVTTGLEARMTGEIRAVGAGKFNRFTLFETFVRRKLGSGEGDGYALLTRIAQFLSDHITFNLSVRQAEGIMQSINSNSVILQAAVDSGLLQRSLTRLSFYHELLLDFFVAASIVGSSPDAEAISQALKLPKNKESRLLVLGAIEEVEKLHPVLESLDDSQLLLAVHQGEAGAAARAWIENKLTQVISDLAGEVKAIAFEVANDAWHPVQMKQVTLRNWSPQESAVLATLSFLLAKGEFLYEILTVIAAMDEVCDQELRRLREEPREKQVAIRSGIFAALYVGHVKDKAGLTHLFSPLLSGIAAFFSKREISTEAITRAASQEPLSNGQLYLLLLLCRYSEATQGLYPVMMDRMQNRWKYLPGHLRSQLIDQAPYACGSQDQRIAMIAALNAIHTDTQNVMESTSIFEALSTLGALDEDAMAHEQTVENQLERLLANPLVEEYWGEAAGLFYAQFDHPYQSAYQKVIDQLPTEKKKIFYSMALRRGDSPLFLTSLIFSAAQVLEVEICPLLLRFTQQPIADEHMPQHSLAVFIFVHLLLARFRSPLNSRLATEADALQKSLFACAELYYWLNREDLPSEERQRRSLHAAGILFDLSNPYALETIWQCERAIYITDYEYYLQNRNIQWPIPLFHQQVAEVSRKVLQHPEWAKGIFDFSNEHIPHAIGLLKRCGNLSDILLLKNIVAHPVWGSSAVDAIKALES